jgi:hypothetical protein
MSDQSRKRGQHAPAPQSAKAAARALPTVGLAILVVSSLAVWLRSRRTQPAIDAQTAHRLSPQGGPADHSTASASDIVIGEPVDARSSS